MFRASVIASLFALTASAAIAQTILQPETIQSATAPDQTLSHQFKDSGGNTKGLLLYGGANPSGNRYFGLINSASDYLGLYTTNDFIVFTSPASVEAMRVLANGRVGIGTSTPAVKLHVHDDGILTSGSNAGFIFRERNTIPNPSSWVWYAQADHARLYRSNSSIAGDVMVIDTAGRVSIGSAPPESHLTVNASGDAVIGTVSRVIRTAGALNAYGGYFAAVQGAATAIPRAVGLYTQTYRSSTSATGLVTDAIGLEVFSLIDATYGVVATNNYGILISNVNNVNALNNYALYYNFSPSPFVITGAGNVGVGTANPQKKLDVQGDINVSGNINAKYQDIAEWVPASADLPPGTVVVLDPRSPNTVHASAREYDETVAGVISPKPGLILGEDGDGKELVATTGRVRVRVDASRRPIRIGDLLVTSGKAGLAMRSEPMDINGRKFHQPGTILGKALEPLANGEGEILVLLSLQ